MCACAELGVAKRKKGTGDCARFLALLKPFGALRLRMYARTDAVCGRSRLASQ